LQPGLADQADRGQPIVSASPTSPAAVALSAIATELDRQASRRTMTLPIINQ
jgi:hypothetical protein